MQFDVQHSSKEITVLVCGNADHPLIAVTIIHKADRHMDTAFLSHEEAQQLIAGVQQALLKPPRAPVEDDGDWDDDP